MWPLDPPTCRTLAATGCQVGAGHDKEQAGDDEGRPWFDKLTNRTRELLHVGEPCLQLLIETFETDRVGLKVMQLDVCCDRF